LTKRYTQQAIEFIKENRERPFFLYLPQTFPHIPLFASESFENTSRRGLYGDVIEELDWSVGQILDTLKALRLDKTTLVLFTSDNGPWLSVRLNGGSAGLLRGGKFTTWEGGHREPGLAWWPDTIPAGTVNMTMASTLDVMPTLLDFAGIEMPTDRVMDGYSLRDALTRCTEGPREVMFYYSGPALRAVRWRQWKLHVQEPKSELQGGYNQVERPLLFNLEQDPGEQYDVADRHPDIINVIQRLAEKHEATMG
jgi:arylsulfatase A-like enzyme